MEIKTASENYTYEVLTNSIATVGATASIDSQGTTSLSFNTRNVANFFADGKSREAMVQILNNVLDIAEKNYNETRPQTTETTTTTE
ncbi:hypothetical protein [Lactococcus sp.]|uniref:hypothetical protein n=1 Tax=Lactococcus sp. TaxID=44273 RepID=UPI0035B18270